MGSGLWIWGEEGRLVWGGGRSSEQVDERGITSLEVLTAEIVKALNPLGEIGSMADSPITYAAILCAAGLACILTTNRGPGPYLDVLSEGVEDLLGHSQGFGEVDLSWLVNHVFPRVIPVEITD